MTGLKNEASNRYPIDVLSGTTASKGGTKVMLAMNIVAISDTGIHMIRVLYHGTIKTE